MKLEAICIALTILAGLPTAGFGTARAETTHDMGHPTTRSDTEDRCSVLQRQYEAVASEHKADPHAEVASGLHSAGVSACQSNEINIGVEKLEQALREIGVKPAE